jgi:phenylpropionate dioxygenase-like ring-hydroxylating dioxygenase large terminal subunit
MIIYNQWYIIGPSSQIKTGQPFAFQIGTERLVAFRTTNNQIAALKDQCCHRGVPLSKGRVQTNGDIACGYHGWQYDSSGCVTKIPSLDANSSLPKYRIQNYPTFEDPYYAWVWMPGSTTEPPFKPELKGMVPGIWIQQTAIWRVDIMAAIENQLDVTHTAFAHPGTYPGHTTSKGDIPKLQKNTYQVTADENSVTVFGVGSAESAASKINIPTPAKPTAAFGRFELPFRNYVFLPNQGVRAIYNWVPLNDGECRLEFLSLAKNFFGSAVLRKPHLIFQDKELELLSQDRNLLEAVQSDFGSDEEKHVRPDAAGLAARDLIESMRRQNPVTPSTTRFTALT